MKTSQTNYVFFVDILGIGALTKNQINLSKVPLAIHGIKRKNIPHNAINHHLAAALLSKFREILVQLNTKHEQVKVAQLSDCAFIWSTNIKQLFLFACEFMHESIKNGILCRAGFASGDVIESTEDGKNIGKFIVGSAVTSAVKLERSGKGCRIFTEEDCAGKILSAFSRSTLIHKIIKEVVIPTDYSVIDEIKWYLLSTFGENLDESVDSENSLRKTIYNTVSISTCLNYSPIFSWNASNAEGRIHLSASIEAITSSVSLLIKNSDYKRDAYLVKDFLIKRSNRDFRNRLKHLRSDVDNIQYEQNGNSQ